MSLRFWIIAYFSEVRRVIGGLGECRKPKVFKALFAEYVKQDQYSNEQLNQHFTAFKNAKLKAFLYEKPEDAAQKPENARKSKRRIRLPEPTMFSARVNKTSTDLSSEPIVILTKVCKVRKEDQGLESKVSFCLLQLFQEKYL